MTVVIRKRQLLEVFVLSTGWQSATTKLAFVERKWRTELLGNRSALLCMLQMGLTRGSLAGSGGWRVGRGGPECFPNGRIPEPRPEVTPRTEGEALPVCRFKGRVHDGSDPPQSEFWGRGSISFVRRSGSTNETNETTSRVRLDVP